MEERRKSNKVLKVLVVILFLFLLASLGALGYGYYKYKGLNDKYNATSNKYNEIQKKYEDVNTKYNAASKDLEKQKANDLSGNYITAYYGYNLYATIGYAEVIGYNGNMYLVQDLEGAGGCFSEINEARFKNGLYKCENNSDDEDEGYIRDLNVKESEINKVFIANFPASSDAQYTVFLIYKNGKVKISHTGDKLVQSNSLKKYKVKDIKKFYCSGGGWDKCGDLRLDIILQDGTEKTIEDFSYDIEAF